MMDNIKQNLPTEYKRFFATQKLFKALILRFFLFEIQCYTWNQLLDSVYHVPNIVLSDFLILMTNAKNES